MKILWKNETEWVEKISLDDDFVRKSIRRTKNESISQPKTFLNINAKKLSNQNHDKNIKTSEMDLSKVKEIKLEHVAKLVNNKSMEFIDEDLISKKKKQKKIDFKNILADLALKNKRADIWFLHSTYSYQIKYWHIRVRDLII